MLIKLFIFFLLLLILPDWYIYRAYIHRVSQKWIRRAYWIPTLFLVTGMTVIFSIHEPMPDSMYRLSNFLLIFLCFAVPKAIFVIVILIMKLLFLISGRRLYGGYIAGVVALASLAYVVYGATEGKQHFQIYNPQNEMFRLLGTKRSFSQNETFFFSHPYPALFRLISHF